MHFRVKLIKYLLLICIFTSTVVMNIQYSFTNQKLKYVFTQYLRVRLDSRVMKVRIELLLITSNPQPSIFISITLTKKKKNQPLSPFVLM